jgi:hypothetical protein
MSQTIKYFCLAANPSANDGTAANKGGYLSIGGTQALAGLPSAMKNFAIQLNAIKNGFATVYAAEVLRVVTVTPTAVAGGEYRLTLSAEKVGFDSNLPNEVQTTFTHTAPTGATATTIGDAFRTAINNHPFWGARVAASGTTTLVLTAKAGYPIFTVGVGPYMAMVYTTAGAAEKGESGANLLATGNFNSEVGLPVAGTNYGLVSFEVKTMGESEMGNGSREQYMIYVSGASGTPYTHGNWAQLVTQLSALVVK